VETIGLTTGPDAKNADNDTGQSPAEDAARRPRRRRATAAEMAARLAFARRLVATGCRKGKIKRALRRRFGPLSARTIERILTDASADSPRRTVAMFLAVIRCETGHVRFAKRLCGPVKPSWREPNTLADWCNIFPTNKMRLAELVMAVEEGGGDVIGSPKLGMGRKACESGSRACARAPEP
jgi:hypothetical protein